MLLQVNKRVARGLLLRVARRIGHRDELLKDGDVHGLREVREPSHGVFDRGRHGVERCNCGG